MIFTSTKVIGPERHMNHKESVRSIITRQSARHVAFDIFEGWMWPGITSHLIEYLGVTQYDQLLDKVGACCRWVTPLYYGPALPAKARERVASPHSTYSLNSAIWKFCPGAPEYEMSDKPHPLAGVRSAQELDAYPWPSSKWFDFNGMAAAARQYPQEFVVAGGFSPIFYLVAELQGMENTLMTMIDDPALIGCLVQNIVNFYQAYFAGIIQAGLGCIDAIAFGDDFSSQKALLMSPALWRRYFKPAWKVLFQLAHAAGYFVFFHSCGAVAQIIPDLIEIGVDVLYPIQPLASGMDIITLKERFGRELTFYGGLDVQQLLPHGTPEAVENEIYRLIQLFSEDGGLIISTSHVMMEDVPLENAMTMIKSCRSTTALKS
jgi:uroporphyrinogen decarboxylase